MQFQKPIYHLQFIFYLCSLVSFVDNGFTASDLKYTAEPYLMGYSVSTNGSSRVMPSYLGSPSQIIDFPAEMSPAPGAYFELSTLPIFGGLSNIYIGALSFQWDTLSEISVFAAMTHDDGIIKNNALKYTAAQRLSDPSKRPEKCNNCMELINNSYLGLINFKRRFLTTLPRINFYKLEIPLITTAGLNLKYLKDELEGMNFIAHNLNMDASVHIEIRIPNPSFPGHFERCFNVMITGFELLQTQQFSEYGREKVSARYHMNMYWNEKFRKVSCTLGLGVIHQPEWSDLPGVALRVNYKEMLTLRAGFQEPYISGGLSFRYKQLALHYAIRNHQLGTSLYQLSLQAYLNTSNWFEN